LDNRVDFMSKMSGSAGAVRGSPIRKCPGFKACKSDGSLDRGDKRRELRHASIMVKRVYISSKLKVTFL
jgi:hypothetical protein